MSPARKNKSTGFAVLAVGCVLLGRHVSFVSLNARRAVLSGALLPVLLPTDRAEAKEAKGVAPAAKPAAAPVAKPAVKENRISRASVGGDIKYSFVLPGKDFEAQKDQPLDTAYYVRKDGSFITMKVAAKGALKKRLFQRDGPGNGFLLEKFEEDEKQDVLEWTKLPTVQKVADGGGAQPGGFLFIGQGDADPTSYHQWYRSLHTEKGDVLITVGINSDAFAKDETMFRKVVDSFRID